MKKVTLHPGDNRTSLRRLIDQGVRVHSVVTDPPYGLVSIEKRFGKEDSKPARREKNDGSFARLSGGFMGKTWDGSGIERDPEFWKLIYDVLLPGGYVFAFSGSRTGHWQACAMEFAGFIMHPMHGWCFGSGFPKAHNPRLEEWEGWAYGTQAQKPALEPIYLGQKPFSEKTGAANLLKHGVGAVNIDSCRVPSNGESLGGGDTSAASVGKKGNEGWERPWMKDEAAKEAHAAKVSGNVAKAETLGRHPANLLLDGSPDVVAMFPAKAGAAAPVRGTEPSSAMKNAYNSRERVEGAFHGDSGSAARFFHQFRYACEQCQDTGVIYTPMQSIGDSPTLEGCECGGPLHTAIDPLIYNGKAGKVDRGGSDHPTVKPIALMQYLVRHITPPGGTVLDPFAGTGTTAVAAQREGFECILMEAEPDYIEFLRKRFAIPDNTAKKFDHLLGDDVPAKRNMSFEEMLS